MKTILRVLLLSLVAILSCSAITVQFNGAAYNVTDGAEYVGPYNLTVGGTPLLGYCINYNIQVANTWDATETPISDYSDPMYTKLREAEWLTLQFATQSQGNWADIHHAIWNLFGASYSGSQAWIDQASTHYKSVDPNSFYLLVANPNGASQNFLINTPVNTASPEAASMLLCGAVLVLVSMIRKRK